MIKAIDLFKGVDPERLSLEDLLLWVCWSREMKENGNPTKVPYTPNGNTAENNNPETWSALEDCKRAVKRGVKSWRGTPFTGVGVILGDIEPILQPPTDPETVLVGVDIDAHNGGDRNPLEEEILARFPETYAERSPSGKGVHILMLCDRARFVHMRQIYSKCKRTDGTELECYPGAPVIEKSGEISLKHTYFTVTGKEVPGREGFPIVDMTDALEAFLRDYFAGRQAAGKAGKDKPTEREKGSAAPEAAASAWDQLAAAESWRPSDDWIIDRIRSDAKHPKAAELWAGNWTQYAYQSQSEADEALCNILYFWAEGDAARMEELFMRSGLYRPGKGADYIRRTVNEACDFMSGKNAPVFNPRDYYREQLIPEAMTDLGEADVFTKLYRHRIRYSEALGWLVYDGRHWTPHADADAERIFHEMIREQRAKALTMLKAAHRADEAAADEDDETRRKAARDKAGALEKEAKAFEKFCLQQQRAAQIRGAFGLARIRLHEDPTRFDADPYKLCTPSGLVDLRSGEIRPNSPEDYCTKITACGLPDKPTKGGGEAVELWQAFLDQLTDGDTDLQNYLRQISGLMAIGRVKVEKLFIAYGPGGNGKSTFFNTIKGVLGSYADSFPAAALLADFRGNTENALAKLMGVRMALLAELEEGKQLSTSVLKQLSSTDPIAAKLLYHDFFSFEPSHTPVLYTNHFPKIGTLDRGTWDRLVVIPFEHRFRGSSGEIENYADHLQRQAGPEILAWIIDGAREVAAHGYKVEPPQRVRELTESFRTESDWLSEFIDARCVLDPKASVGSGELYKAYRDFAFVKKDKVRSASDFRQAMEQRRDINYQRQHGWWTLYGLRLRDPDEIGF